MRFLHGVAVVIGGGRLKLHVEDIVQRRHVCFIHNFDRVAVAARLQGGGGGIGGQLGGNLLVDLCHGQPQAHGLILVDADIHLGIAGLLTVRDVLNAVNEIPALDNEQCYQFSRVDSATAELAQVHIFI